MKRLICALLFFVLLLSGCAGLRTGFADTAAFYYRRDIYRHNETDPVIVAEKREITGHAGDLQYLLNLYLMGPVDKNLRSPFPAGVKLLELQKDNGSITIILTDTGRSLTDANFSLACECIGRTCMALTDASKVTVISGSRSLDIQPGSVLLTDDATAPAESEETQQ